MRSPTAGQPLGRVGGIGGVAHDGRPKAGSIGTLHKNCVPRGLCTLQGTVGLAPDKQGRGVYS